MDGGDRAREPSFITVKALPEGQAESAARPLLSLIRAERGRDLPWHLVSGFKSSAATLALLLSLPLSASLSHTYSPGQWLYFNMVMIRDGGSGKGGEGAHIYSRGIWGGRCDGEAD